MILNQLVESQFKVVVCVVTALAILASENFKVLKHRMETKLNISSDDQVPKAN